MVQSTGTTLQQSITARCYYFWSGIEKPTTETDADVILGWGDFGSCHSNRLSNNSVHVAPGGTENSVGTLTKDNCVSGGNIANFLDGGFSEVNGVALEKYPCPAAGASQWRLPGLLGDDTHAVVTRPRWAREHGRHNRVWSRCVGGWEACPTDNCNKDTGRSERKTPIPCEYRQAQRQWVRQREREREKKKLNRKKRNPSDRGTRTHQHPM